MPRPPHFASAVADMPSAVFSPIDCQLDPLQHAACPLHVGDTWMEPFVGARMEDLRQSEVPGLHRYTETQGIPEPLDAIVDRVRVRNALDCGRDSVLVAAGVTGALCTAVGALAAPGEEILILAPLLAADPRDRADLPGQARRGSVPRPRRFT